MRLLAQHSVGENPYSRAPLHAAMARLAQRPDAGGALLLDQPLAKLHPASWCAAALEHPRSAGCLCRTTLSDHSWRSTRTVDPAAASCLEYPCDISVVCLRSHQAFATREQ